MQKNLKISQILKTAKPVQHKSIVNFRHLRQDVYSQLAEAEQVAGIKVGEETKMYNCVKETAQ